MLRHHSQEETTAVESMSDPAEMEGISASSCSSLHGEEGSWSISKFQGDTPEHKEKTGSLPRGRVTLS